jgi:hypothetical protein
MRKALLHWNDPVIVCLTDESDLLSQTEHEASVLSAHTVRIFKVVETRHYRVLVTCLQARHSLKMFRPRSDCPRLTPKRCRVGFWSR